MSKDVLLNLGQHGSLRGTVSLDVTHRFLNIPYALPPIGERRWRKPVHLPKDHIYTDEAHSSSARDCTTYGDICLQPPYLVNGKDMSIVPGANYSEDCLVVNIWKPTKPLPTSGEEKWPVLAWIHGGWLQIGSPSHQERHWPEGLIDPDGGGLNAVVVSIGYRLNIFGFLAGHDLKGNFGFWDQRCALEWVQDYIHYFGGDRNKVTLGGHSAGAYSTHAQLQYELLHTDGSRPLFHNVWLCSNAIPAQPKSLEEATTQLENVFAHFQISPSLPLSQRLDGLREIDGTKLIESFHKLRLHTFRAVTDGEFIRGDMIEKFRDGTFARLFKERGVRILIGETENEQWLYSKVVPPESLAGLPRALENYYAAQVCERLMSLSQYQATLDISSSTDKDDRAEAERLYGMITSDAQVRAPIRALCHQLMSNGVPVERILRYRIALRPRCLDKFYPPEAGVTHGGDMYTWWLTRHMGLMDSEAVLISDWLKGSLCSLVNSEPFEWVSREEDGYVYLGEDGSVEVVHDEHWKRLGQVIDLVLS
ncbi:hypothetical protein H2204_003224 [Knufia peltigerae]|uniref:Carboxylic ester hydrolase n=1 Tax=Knufia peltigerae TaxID=1002370 RepID=A0AA39D0G1_9EURO|nr:hypothetical protein H2204_003224 [Knufia peltigerae]